MIDIPEEIKNLFRKDNLAKETQKKIKLTFYDDTFDTLYPYETLFPSEELFPSEHGDPWIVIENDRIETESLTITESLSASEDMEWGSCESTAMEIMVADVIEDVTGREFTLSVEIGGYEFFLGIFTVDSFVRQADRRKRKITAYDRMRLFQTDVSTWYNDLTFPIKLKAFRDSLCAYIGVEQETAVLPLDNMDIGKTIEPSELDGLSVLKSICQINGCFGHINKMGKLYYPRLQQTGLYPAEDLFPDEELYPSEFGGDGEPIEYVDFYKSMKYEDYLVDGISGVNIRQEEGDVGASFGDGSNVYTIEGNFLVYGKSAVELLNIAQTVYGMIYGRTYRPANLECYAMPWLEVGDAIQAQTKDDMVETFLMKRVTKGVQAMGDSIESTGKKERKENASVRKQVIQLQGKTAVIIKNVDEVSAKVTDLKNYTEAQVKILSDEVSIRVKKGQVSAEISVESDKVTLSGNRLIVNSTNFTLDGNGNAVFSGRLSAASGDFSGTVHADSGSFNSVTISGCTLRSNTQTGTLSGGTFSGGTISGGTLSSSTGGTYVGTCSRSTLSSCSTGGTTLSVANGSVTSYGGGTCLYGESSSRLRTGSGTLYVTGGNIVLDNSTTCYGNFSCTGTKSRTMQTEHFGKRQLDALETPVPMFSDCGVSVLDENGYSYIVIDPVFSEVVNKEYKPIVFLTKYGEGDIYFDEEKSTYGIIALHGTPGLRFSWETRYQQGNCCQDRMRIEGYDRYEVSDVDFALSAEIESEHNSIDYENEANEYLMLYELQSVNYADEGAKYYNEFERGLVA